jgi:hypothetical protein
VSGADQTFDYETSGFHVGAAGTVKVDMVGGGTVVYVCVTGALYPYAVSKIYKVGTTATQIVAVF